MNTATEKLEKIANFDSYFKVWINASRQEGATDQQIIDDLKRIVKIVEEIKPQPDDWRHVNRINFEDIQKALKDTAFKKSTYTKVEQLCFDSWYTNLGELYDDGPAAWALEPYVGLKTINCASSIINYFAGKELIPMFQSMAEARKFEPEVME